MFGDKAIDQCDDASNDFHAIKSVVGYVSRELFVKRVDFGNFGF
jgi:hypothetical protein